MTVKPPVGRRTARAGTNIALVKYWGKRDAALNLPATGSLSLTLSGLETITSVHFKDTLGTDEVFEADQPADPKFSRRASRFLDLVRGLSGERRHAEVRTRNSFPTGAGLASSASGFAALALAATHAAGLTLSPIKLSELARRGSGSAARSIFGGFVSMNAGQLVDGSDAVAAPLAGAEDWDVRLVVAVTARGSKNIGSTEAMDHTAKSSPYYPAWLASVPDDLAHATRAIAARDLPALGVVVERSALRMHASAMAADPGILYWNGVTIEAMAAIRTLRNTGIAAYFTMDAGPHVKVLCQASDAEKVRQILADVPGILDVMVATPGSAAAIVPEE